ncbi:PREDICTED: unconventional myosin-Ig-like [Thamnophis sirtalis]|uniref:Unconventional myosin-Ig-like n=1 Tax=Thamnophis sirtalis TaxID=35019 RepID=A0A6I9Y561_9SAUR|nr:PREDICTED: unconventional myosin-Ig-like [Thamnophis sirtalis]
MTCEYTWPNHLMATDAAATRALIEQHGFQDDVAYGQTKIFIRTPRTLFALEEERSNLIPIIVLLLQKEMWPEGKQSITEVTKRPLTAATLFKNSIVALVDNLASKVSQIFLFWWRARQLVTNIPPSEMGQIKAKVAAFDVLQGRRKNWGCCQNWRQNYLVSVWRGALARKRCRYLRAIYTIMAYYKRHKVKSHLLELLQRFQGVRSMADYGKSVEWPEPPEVLAQFQESSKLIFCRNNPPPLLSLLPQAEENSALAAQFLKQVSTLKEKMHFSSILFSCHVRKINRCNKRTDRALLITDQHLYKLDPRKQYRVKKTIALGTTCYLYMSIEG